MMEKTFLLFDDNSPNYFIGRRTASQLKPEFQNMKIGEIRMLSETIGIEREK